MGCWICRRDPQFPYPNFSLGKLHANCWLGKVMQVSPQKLEFASTVGGINHGHWLISQLHGVSKKFVCWTRCGWMMTRQEKIQRMWRMVRGSVAHLHLLYIISILFFQKKNIDFMDIGDPFFLRPRLALIVYRSFLQRPVKTWLGSTLDIWC